MKNVIIEIRGGALQAVYSDCEEIIVELIDHDNGAVDEDDYKANELLLKKIKKENYKAIW